MTHRMFTRISHALAAASVSALTALAATGASAGSLDAWTFAEEVKGAPIHVSHVGGDYEARISDDGRVALTGALGAFDGHWYAAEQLFCIYFDHGPQTGETCVTIERMADGSYATSNGRVITVASGS